MNLFKNFKYKKHNDVVIDENLDKQLKTVRKGQKL